MTFASVDTAARRWAASGVMWLTGRPGGPHLGAPRGLVDGVDRLAARLAAATRAVGSEVVVDGLALLGERAAIAGLSRRGHTSCGGGTRLMEAADDWIAVALPRPDDLELLPAWLGVEAVGDPWDVVAEVVRGRDAAAVVETGSMLGLAVSRLAESAGRDAAAVVRHRDTTRVHDAPIVVVDLSSLWAGPLCGQLLGAAGMRVVKVESIRRPDGARSGPRRFFDLLNSAKESVAVDVTAARGRETLTALIAAADVVIEASRPRALRQLGIDRDALMASSGVRVWASITGHGRDEPHAMRVGFGDDAAVAGGLVARDADGPVFCGDAIADPATGLLAAATVAECLVAGGRWTVDVSLAGTAASLATGDVLPAAGRAARPTARVPTAPAHALGADTEAVLASLGITR